MATRNGSMSKKSTTESQFASAVISGPHGGGGGSLGASRLTVTAVGEPGRKSVRSAVPRCGAVSASKRKLYRHPQRSAFAFWFVAKSCVSQVSLPPPLEEVQSA